MDNAAAALTDATEARRKLGEALAVLAENLIRNGADPLLVEQFVNHTLDHIDPQF